MNIALFGAGRIGRIHAANLAASGLARLSHVVDVDPAAAAALAAQHGAKPAAAGEVFADPAVGAVMVCSSTDTHADLVIRAAEAGKAVFCEKPVDLSLARVDACLAAVRRAGIPLFVAFNRRFDPSFAALKARLAAGEIGRAEQVVITSRDPGPPPLAYIKVSGGLFRDMTIHDFDMARWLLGEEPDSVYATGACLVDPAIADAGDIDTAMVILTTPSGRQAFINNTRRAAYGYDQRIEVHGPLGRLSAGNLTETTVEAATTAGVSRDKPLHFFLERYAAAYRAELAAFLAALREKTPMPVSGEDGRLALVLAEAAARSAREGRPVRVAEVVQ
ncbi:MAG: inositol 2-dehydrogenase [Thalassobaculales bacterium]